MLTAGTVRGLLELDDRFTSALARAATQAQTNFARIAASAHTSGSAMSTGMVPHLEKLDRGLTSAGNTMRQSGMAMTAGFTVPIVAGFGYAVKAAMSFESSFAGVRKTVGDVTDMEGNLTAFGRNVSAEFRNMAKSMPASVEEINKVGEAAGALGIESGNLVEFTRTMVKLGATTNLSSDQAATSLARFTNVMGGSAEGTRKLRDNIGGLASALVHLGNNGASTEAEIMEMALRISGAAATVGMTSGEVLGLANAMSSMGIEAEMGGTAVQRMIMDMAQSVSSGAGNLQHFAGIAKMTTDEFQRMFKSNPGEAFAKFTAGLQDAKLHGTDMIALLQSMDVNEQRLINTMLRTANAGDMVAKSMRDGTAAMQAGVAMDREYEQRLKTTTAQMTIFWNKIRDVAITFGSALLPIINDAMTAMTPFISKLAMAVEWFGRLPAPIKTTGVVLAGIVALGGPMLMMLGMMTSGLGSLMGGAALAGKALGGMHAMLLKLGMETGPLATVAAKTLVQGYRAQTLATTALGLAKGGLLTALNGVASMLLRMVALINPVTITIGALMLAVRYLTGSWDFLIVPLKAAWNIASDFASMLPGFASAIGTWLVGAVQKAVDLFLLFNPGIVAAYGAVRDFGTAVVDWFGRAWKAVDNFFGLSDKWDWIANKMQWVGDKARDAWAWLKMVAEGDVKVTMPELPGAPPGIKPGLPKLPQLPGDWDKPVTPPYKPPPGAGGDSPIEKYNKELQALTATLTGSKAQAELKKLNDAIATMNPTALTNAATLKRISEAATKLSADGAVLEGKTRDIWIAQRGWLEGMPKVGSGLDGIRFGTRDLVSELGRYQNTILGITKMGGIGEVMGGLPGLNVTDRLGESLVKTNKAAEESIERMQALADSFAQLAEIAGGSAGIVLKGTASILTALTTTKKQNLEYGGSFGIANAMMDKSAPASERWASAVASAGAIAQGAMSAYAAGANAANKAQAALGGAMEGAKAGAMFGPWGVAIGAAAGALLGLVGAANKGRKAMQDFYASFTSSTGMTGMTGLREELNRLGAQGETLWVNLTQKTGKGDLEAANKNIKAIQDALAALDADIQKYNLTWLDQANAMTGAKEAGDALAASYARLTADGYSSDAVLRAMSSDINTFITNALSAGATIPAGMAPIIESLIRQGMLTEENARLMLGLGEDSMPTLASIKEAADRYGLSLDALGPKVQQLQLTEAAAQIVKDWNVLTNAGADVGVLFSKMGDEIQGMVDQALTAGLALPESMRPMLQALLDGGYLTDAAGEKLKDLSGIKFEESLAKQIDKLVLALQNFVDAINADALPALDHLGRQRVTIPYGFEHDGRGIRDPEGDVDIEAPQFRTGTHGRLRDFGPGTLVELHGRERVQTEGEFNAEQQALAAQAALGTKLDAIHDLLRRQPSLMQIAIRDGILQAQ
jgi:TP901 family phage tail tape measure protein